MAKLPSWAEVWSSILALRPSILDGCELDPNEEGWVSIHCPGHDDENPSLRVNTESGGVKCMATCSPMSDVTNLNLLEDYILDRSNIRQRGKRPKDVIGDLAERRMLPRDWLIDKFGIGVAHSGYIIPIDDPEVDPEIEIDYDIDGITRELHVQVKRGEWYDKAITRRPKYHWEPKLSKSNVKSQSLIYNLQRVLPTISKERTVYICAGAPDVWVMARAGFAAISFLAGEGNMPNQRAIQKLRDADIKEAIIIYDLDDTGREASGNLAIELSQAGLAVTTIDLPEDLGKGGDITDLWQRCEGNVERFEEALDQTSKRVWPTEDVPSRDAQQVRRTKPVPLSLPEECWVPPWDVYRESLRKNTAACDEYHFFALMNIIGAVFGRRVYTYYGKRLFPNQYTVLIGPTGSFKSTANSRAIELVNALYARGERGALEGTALTIEQAMGSAEGLLEAAVFADAEGQDEYDQIKVMLGWKKATDDGHQLEEDDLFLKPERRMLIHQDEFCRLLTKAASGGGSGLITHLLTAFDCPPEVRLRTRKHPLILINSVTSILADSTLAKLSQHFDEIEWSSGFGNRIVFVDGRTVEPLPRTRPPDEGMWEDVIDQIRAAYRAVPWQVKRSRQEGTEFVLSEEAEQEWDKNCLGWMDSRREGVAEEEIAATERVGDYAMKFALIYATMTKGHECTIVPEDIDLGWKAARYGESVTMAMMGKLIDEKVARWQENIKDYIAVRQPISKRDLQQHFRRIPAPQINQILVALKEMAVIIDSSRGYIMAES